MLKLQLLEEMRELYRQGNIQELKKKRTLASWLLDKSERDKIDRAIMELDKESEFVQAARKYLPVKKIIYY
mgnify:CR=1 FL=1